MSRVVLGIVGFLRNFARHPWAVFAYEGCFRAQFVKFLSSADRAGAAPRTRATQVPRLICYLSPRPFNGTILSYAIHVCASHRQSGNRSMYGQAPHPRASAHSSRVLSLCPVAVEDPPVRLSGTRRGGSGRVLRQVRRRAHGRSLIASTKATRTLCTGLTLP